MSETPKVKILRVDHVGLHLAGIASLLGDDATSDVTFTVMEATSHGATVVHRESTDTGTGSATRSPAVVLDADFRDEDAGAYNVRGGAVGGDPQSVSAGATDTRRAVAVSGQYAKALRADAIADKGFEPQLIEIRAHRAILAAASGYFRDRLYRPSTLGGDGRSFGLEGAVELPEGCTAQAFMIVREYCYTGQCAVNMSNCVDVLAACALLGLEALAAVVEPFAVESLTDANMFTVLYQADAYCQRTEDDECKTSAMRTIEAAIAYFCSHAPRLVQDEQFLRMPVHLLEKIVMRDDLVLAEIDVFESILRWVEADRTSRAQPCLETVTPWLRVPQLSVREIMKLIKPSGIVADELWLEALDYLSAPSEQAHPKYSTRPWMYLPRAGQLRTSGRVKWDPRSTLLTLHDRDETIQSWSGGWRGALCDCQWSTGGSSDEYSFSVRMDCCFNLGNEWEAIVGIVPRGSDVREGDGAWAAMAGYIVGTGEKTANGQGEGEPYGELVQAPLAQDGSIITIVYRPEEGSLETILDGESLGLAYESGIEPPVQPAIAIDARAKFTLLDSEQAIAHNIATIGSVMIEPHARSGHVTRALSRGEPGAPRSPRTMHPYPAAAGTTSAIGTGAGSDSQQQTHLCLCWPCSAPPAIYHARSLLLTRFLASRARELYCASSNSSLADDCARW